MSRFLSSRLAYMTPYKPGEQPPVGTRLVKLNTNENPFPPSPKVMAALKQTDLETMRLYPDPGTADLCHAAAKLFGLRSTQVMASNGSDEVLAFIFQGLCEEGVVFSDISYDFYEVWAALYNVTTEIVPLREDFQLFVEDYLGKKGTIIITNPNAPTGMAIPVSDIEYLLNQDKTRLVVVDEAYADFARDNAVRLLAKYDNLLIIRTLSKGYSLAGARVGLALGSEALIDDLNKIKFCFNPYNVNRLSIVAGAAALMDQPYFEACRDRVIHNRTKLSQQLSEMGFAVLESSANFIFAGRHFKLSAADYYAALRDRGILVRYFPAPLVDDFVRISIGDEEDSQALINATAEILSHL